VKWDEETQKAAKVGAAGAVLLIVIFLIKYLIRDVLPYTFNVNPGYDISSLVGFISYGLTIAAGFAVGYQAAMVYSKGNLPLRSIVTFSAVAGIALGAVCFVFQVLYDLVFRPAIVGYSYSALDALISILYSGVDIAMFAGLAIAGGVLYTVFVLNSEQVPVETRIKG
jgi:hypothetical protein